MRARRLFLVFSLLCWPGTSIIGPAAAQTPIESEQTIDQIAAYFEAIVFGREFERAGGKEAVLQKWSKPIGISVQGLGVKLDPERVKVLESHVRKIAGLVPAVRFGFVKSDDARAVVSVIFAKRSLMANLNIEGVSKTYLQKLALTGGCYFLTFARAGEIERAVVVINAERTVHGMDHCMLEELTQVMGLVNDSDLLRPSLFSDRDQMTTLSRADEILLRALYDHRLKAGMSRDAAMPIARELIKAWDQRLPPP